jgi:rare lipoprotein A (peptidoglycan hydrolase)
MAAPRVGALAVLCAVGISGSAAVSVAAGPAPSANGAGFAPAGIVTSQVVRANVLLGQAITLVGSIAPQLGTQTVALQVGSGGGWTSVAAAQTESDGAYIVRYRPRRIGSFAMRAVVTSVATVASAASPSERVNVYHRVLASWYDLLGARTACGEVLEPRTLGVANKTLPCGTPVTFRHGDRIVRVPVIDRGPYVAGRDYDLTPATKAALGAGDLTELWATR